jgi:hypothetical protein
VVTGFYHPRHMSAYKFNRRRFMGSGLAAALPFLTNIALGESLKDVRTIAFADALLPTQAASVNLIVSDSGKIKSTVYPSISEAIRAAEEARKGNPDARLRIELGQGVHRINDSVVLPASISGTPGSSTVITAKKGTKAVLSGSRLLPVKWHPYAKGIFVADVVASGFDQLRVDGVRQIRARYPNYDPKVIPFGGYAADALSPERVAHWSNPTGGEVHALQVARWGSAFFRILGKNPDNSLILGPPSGNNRVRPPQPGALPIDTGHAENAPHPIYRYVENILEELDAPGEWFFDVAKAKLYYMPTDGVDLAKASVEATALEQLIVIDATQANPVHDIRIEGLTFSHTSRTVMKATEPMLRSDWAISRSGAIMIEGAERVTIANSDFRELGGNAVFISGYNRDVTVRGNIFEDIGSTAISFVGRQASVCSPVFQYANSFPFDQMDKTPGPKTAAYPAQSTARDNLITRIGLTDKQAAGITIDIAQDITLSHNSIYHVPRAGINVGDGCFGGHVIEHNDVFDTVLETNDHGSFNSWARDRYWDPDRQEMNRRVAADPSLPFLDTVKPITLRNNRWQTADGFDVDLDDGSTNYEIYDNVMLRGGLKLREGFRRIVTNNVIINNSLHPHVSFKNSGDVFQHNIVMGPYQPIGVEQWDFAFDYNLFTRPAQLKAAQALGSDQHSKVGDPKFVDAKRGDFRVKPGSPALALGFKNFPMDFGVESTRLRALARTPAIPELLTSGTLVAGKTYDFSGATIKSIETLDEQSATGSPDRTGALVVSVRPGSLASVAGLQKEDVIRSVDVSGSDFIVSDAPTLLVLQASQKWQQRLRINVLRNQQILQLQVPYK